MYDRIAKQVIYLIQPTHNHDVQICICSNHEFVLAVAKFHGSNTQLIVSVSCCGVEWECLRNDYLLGYELPYPFTPPLAGESVLPYDGQLPLPPPALPPPNPLDDTPCLLLG
jgi:hypothetical protein